MVRKRNNFDSGADRSWAGFRFKTRELETLYTTAQGEHKYSPAVVKGFFKAMQTIAAAKNKRDLYQLRSLQFHSLHGARKGEYAVQLTGNWRLIVTIEQEASEEYLVICKIEDYH